VILGVDISADPAANGVEAENAIRLANTHPNVRSVLVGNEVLLHNRLRDRPYVDPAVLYRWIDLVRDRAEVPVSSAEPFPTWMAVPELARHTDFVAVNALPYWAGEGVERAPAYFDGIVRRLSRLVPGQAVLLLEVGWPVAGPSDKETVPGLLRMERFIGRLRAWARESKVDYNYFEAFDQPWRVTHHEGRVGTQWGLMDGRGRPKLGTGPPLAVWSAASIGLAFLIGLVYVRTHGWLRPAAALHFFLWTQALVWVTVQMLYVSVQQYLVYSAGFGCFIAAPGAVLFVLVLLDLVKSTEAIGRRGLFEAGATAPPARPPEIEPPFVSIHLPCSREPPRQVIDAVRSLLALDYPTFEILVIDNNTSDPSLYRPLEAFCADHPAGSASSTRRFWRATKRGRSTTPCGRRTRGRRSSRWSTRTTS
jgi:hypothetical protein